MHRARERLHCGAPAFTVAGFGAEQGLEQRALVMRKHCRGLLGGYGRLCGKTVEVPEVGYEL